MTIRLDDRMDSLGPFSRQCDKCRNELDNGNGWKCKAFTDIPEKYWMNKEVCPKFDTKRIGTMSIEEFDKAFMELLSKVKIKVNMESNTLPRKDIRHNDQPSRKR
jgi:hypothetical protein